MAGHSTIPNLVTHLSFHSDVCAADPLLGMWNESCEIKGSGGDGHNYLGELIT